jgi:hypothetical protein
LVYAPEHVDSGKRKIKIARIMGAVYQLKKKRDFYFINVAKIGKNCPKMELFDFFENSHF